MIHNEDSRVKIPTILHLIRLGYTYLSLKNIKEIEKENQQLSELRDWLLPMLMNEQVTVGGIEQKEGLNMVAEPDVEYKKR